MTKASVGRLDLGKPKQPEPSVREQRLNAAQRIAKIGNWEWDIPNDLEWWSDELHRMLQVDPAAESPSFELFLDRVHPEDRHRLKQSVERVLANGGLHAIDVRVLLPDGVEKIVHAQGEVAFDATGRPVRMSGTLQDITERKHIEQALRASEHRYQEAQRLARIGSWEWNVRTGEEWWSEELYRILEEDPLVFGACFDNFLEKIHPDDRPLLRQGVDRFTAQHRDFSPTEVELDTYEPTELRIVLADGRIKPAELRIQVHSDFEGRPTVVAGTLRDVSERRELERRLRESEDRYSSTVELAAIGIAHVDRDGRFIWTNPQLCALLGYSSEELMQLTTKDVSHPEDRNLTDHDRQRLHAGLIDSVNVEKRYVRKDGRVIWVRIASTLRRDEHGEPLYDISIVEDISDRKAAEERVQFLATHDEMTGLPNRATFIALLDHAIAAAEQQGRKCAVLFIDLDRFKVINDSLGHEAGDHLLKTMSARFSHCMRESDVLARLGGDEFVVLLNPFEDSGTPADVARRILSATLEPIRIADQECRLTASIGIATYPHDAGDAPTLMKHADVAMYMAKEDGKNNFQFYSPEASPMSVERLTLESHLGRAIDNAELHVQYQPQMDLTTGAIQGAEALLRWWNPSLGTIPPSQFIPVAEDTGLIVPIGKWVLEAACRQCVAWQQAGMRPVTMSVNLSARQFKSPELIDDIAEVLERTGLAPELLQLEITESMLMSGAERAEARVSAIKELGVKLAIDDFGIGYSSLSQLKRFPIDTLKIDRSFVRDIPENVEDMAIAEAIISLGKILRVSVVAEGVESATQCAFLRERACDQIQGFYFSRPCHPDAFARLIKDEDRADNPLSAIDGGARME